MVSELLYWRGVARERIEMGASCCRACAATDNHTSDDNLCIACSEEIKFPIPPSWVADTLMCKEQIRWTRRDIPWPIGAVERARERPGEYFIGFIDNIELQELWYDELSEYRHLDEEFGDLQELSLHAQKYSDFRWERNNHLRWERKYGKITRKRSVSHMDSSGSE